MNEKSKETLISNNTILEAINGLRQEVNKGFKKVDGRFDNIETRMNRLDERVKIIENEVFSINVRLMRLESIAHEAISISKSVRADVTVLGAGVTSWTQDVMDLQRKVA